MSGLIRFGVAKVDDVCRSSCGAISTTLPVDKSVRFR